MFIDDLVEATDRERTDLFATPVIRAALQGAVTRAQYIAFLTEAYHHVSHTVPLLTACRDRLPAHHAWLRSELDYYIADETGHDEWILSDIERAGGDAKSVRAGEPGLATDVMVAYAYDCVQRRNPLRFFGMAFVLEGTSVQLATKAADTLRQALDLPESAFTYLSSHGELDIEHTKNFAALVNRFYDPGDRADVTQAAKAFYPLYAGIFRSL
jgi:pyrroloquinoline quinone (PQQ) biosynthesis protein C